MTEKVAKISTHSKSSQQHSQATSPFIHQKAEQSFFAPVNAPVGKTSPTTFIQPKLQISQPGDPYEKEADAMADKVMRMNESAPSLAAGDTTRRKDEDTVQPSFSPATHSALVQKTGEEEVQTKELEEEPVQRKEEEEEQVQPSMIPAAGSNSISSPGISSPKQLYLARKERGPPAVQPHFSQQLHANKGSGKPLDPGSRSYMESRFDADFSSVKVHTDPAAVQMSRSIGAQAFTHGSDIYFNSGKYNPGTGTGRHLLAHELTHTIQQGAATSVRPFLSTKANGSTTSPSSQPVSSPLLQPQAEEENEVQTSLIQAKAEPSSGTVRPELKRAVAYAQSQVGKVDANKKNPDGTRVGYEHLLEYFRSAMGPDKIIPDGGVQVKGSILEKNIREKGKPIKAQKPNQPNPKETVERDAMPSWCGIFVFWSLNKGGVPMPKWTIGGNAVSLKAAYPKSHIPKPGDIAYFGTNSHYAIVEKTEPETVEGKQKNVKVSTVNGNTTGENNLGGQVQVKSHPVSHWDGFFSPLYGLEDKMPKDPAEVSEAEMQQILNRPSNPGTGNVSSEPVGIQPYTPTSAPPSPAPVPEEKKEEAVAEEAKAPEQKVEQPAEPASPKSPAEDPAFQEVLQKTHGAKASQKKHGDPAEKQAAAQLASEVPKDLDIDSQAQFHQVGAMNVQKAGTFSKEAFKAQLMERVKKALPKNDKETLDMYEDSTGVHKRMEEAKTNAKGDVKAEKDKAGNAIATTTEAPPNTAFSKPKETKAMQNEDAGKKPFIPKAETAAPKPKTDGEISMEKEAASLDDEMAKDNVTEDQLAKSNEPTFTGALDEKKDAQTKARNAPADYRAVEDPQLAKAKTQAQGSIHGGMEDMHGMKSGVFGKVDGSKSATKTKDETKRKEIADNLQRIYKATKEKVEGMLNALEKEVTDDFDTAASDANKDFEKRVDARLKDFYGITTVDDTISEWVSGIDPEINLIFTEERDRYVQNMDTAITDIAAKVEKQLNAAMTAIADGKKEIDTYWDSLDPEMKKIGEDAKKEILEQFNELETSVQEKHDSLVEKLGDRYVKNLEQLQETFDKIKAANQGWLSGALNAIKAVIQTIIRLKDMLFETLARIAQVIGDIISDPINFLGNLVKAVGMGLNNFKENIAVHLKKGFFEWLMGNMPPGIVFPDKWDLTGIFHFIMQILGLTWANIRARAVRKLGEPVVSALESVFEIFQIIRKEGLAGLWRFIKEKVGDLKVMVLDAIENFLIEKVVKAGIMWVVGLLNPVGAFIKACQAIYKIVMFFIEKGKQIMDFVNSVIDSIANIVAGNLSGAAKMVEDALARIIPLAIGFLASLLGLDGVSEKVQKIIHAIQAPINKAIDWVLDKAIAFAKKLGIDKLAAKVKGGVDKGKDWAKKKVEQGKTMAKDAAGKVLDWLGIRKVFKLTNGEKHEIYFSNTKDEKAPVVIASTDPNTLETIISTATWQKKSLPPPTVKTLKKEGKAIDDLRPDRTVKAGQKIQGHFNNIATELSTVAGVPVPPSVATPSSRGSGSKLMGEKVTVNPLSLNPGSLSGSDPTVHSDMEEELNRRYPKQFVRGHLLNNNLHGPGTERWNLVPISQQTNSDMKNTIERALKKHVLSEGSVVSFQASVKFKAPLDETDKGYPEKQIPDTIKFTVTELVYENNAWAPSKPQPTWARDACDTITHDTRNIAGFGGAGPLIINLNTSDERDLERLPEIGPAKAAAIVHYRNKNKLPAHRVRWFTSIDQLDMVPGIGPETISALSKASHVKV